jgi:uncharacterized protein with NRDE domain
MCLIAWNWQPDSPCPLLLISNRDEFYARPAAALHRWADAPVVAGRDLQAGGTWLGASLSGRVAALTNHRDPAMARPDAPSRGELVSAFLQGDMGARDYLAQLGEHAACYNPFNLLVFDGREWLGLQSHPARMVHFLPGVGAVSNARFHTPWPKLVAVRDGLRDALQRGGASDADLLALLHDRQVAADAELPATGVALALERVLSARFIATPDYGTRACSVLRLEGERFSFLEHSYDAQGSTGVAHKRWSVTTKTIT